MEFEKTSSFLTPTQNKRRAIPIWRTNKSWKVTRNKGANILEPRESQGSTTRNLKRCQITKLKKTLNRKNKTKKCTWTKRGINEQEHKNKERCQNAKEQEQKTNKKSQCTKPLTTQTINYFLLYPILEGKTYL